MKREKGIKKERNGKRLSDREYTPSAGTKEDEKERERGREKGRGGRDLHFPRGIPAAAGILTYGLILNFHRV